MKESYCQCCAMLMGESDEMYGTEMDGSKSKDYCKYCYDNGKITFQGTMEEIVDICVPYMLKANKNISEQEARDMMKNILPTLKYWKK